MSVRDLIEFEITGQSSTSVSFKGRIIDSANKDKISGGAILSAIGFGAPFGGDLRFNSDGLTFSGKYYTD